MRLAGRDLPREKKLAIALTYIYGIGLSTSLKMLEECSIENKKVKDVSEDEVNRLRSAIEKIKVEGDLRREISLNIRRLTEITCYRGVRHRHNLPLRGQRTKTNARTRRGARRTVAGKKVAPSKG